MRLLFILSVLLIFACPVHFQMVKAHNSSVPAPTVVAQRLHVLFEQVGNYGGNIKTLALGQSAVYVGQGNTLVISAFRDPANPLARLLMPDGVQDIAVANALVFVATKSKGVHIVDVRNPSQPTILNTIVVPGIATAVQVVNGRAYITTTGLNGGLKIIDVQEVAAPTYLGGFSSIKTQSAVAVQVVDHLAYIAAGHGNELEIIDVSQPTSPTMKSSLALPAAAMDVRVVDHIAYVAGGQGGLHIVDVKDLANPRLITSVATSGRAMAVDVVQNTAFVAMHGGLEMVDVSNPNHPVLLGKLALSGESTDIHITPDLNFAYLAGGSGGMYVLQVSDPRQPTTQANLATLYGAVGLQVVDGLAYVVTDRGEVEIIDITTPSRPVQQATYKASGSAHAVQVVQGMAYVATTQGMDILHVQNPISPTLFSHITVPGVSSGVFVQGDIAYLAAGSKGLHIIDVSNPITPTVRGNYNTPGSAFAVQVQGTIAYVADQSNLQILDVSNPVTPTLLGSLRMEQESYAQDVDVDGTIAYVAASGVNGGLKMIDVSDSKQPTLLATLTDEATSVHVVNHIAYITTVNNGVQMIDVQKPSNPVVVAQSSSFGFLHDVQVVGDIVYVADFNGGIHILRVEEAQGVVYLPLIHCS